MPETEMLPPMVQLFGYDVTNCAVFVEPGTALPSQLAAVRLSFRHAEQNIKLAQAEEKEISSRPQWHAFRGFDRGT